MTESSSPTPNESLAPWETDELRAWEADVILGDGSTARIRPIRPTDRDRLTRFHSRQSPESIYFRYFRYRPQLSEKDLDHFTNIDYWERMAFVAVRGDDIIAVARYEPWGDRNEAEVAFFVDDAHHGRGLATLLLEFLAAAGRRRGFDQFTATVLPENYGMLRVFRRAGFDVSTRFSDGVIEVTLGIDVTDDAQAAIGARNRRAIARSVARILEPTSVAIVGASRRPDSVGQRLLRNLIAAPFAGQLHVVNPNATDILGVPSVARLTDLEAPPDLVIVTTPVDAVEQVTQDAVAVGAGAIMVISAGFSEQGPVGAERERRLLRLARDGGVRLLGPNTFGIANTSPEVNLQALFLPVEVVAGSVGMLSESGPLGAGLLNHLSRAGVGVSSFVALGNRADVSVNDLVQYWSEDERTTAIALYVESYGNVRKFSAIAREVSRSKPIVAVKTGDDVLNEMLGQSGVILVDQVADLAEQLQLLVQQPRPQGNRVAVVSNTSSVARLAASAARRSGLVLSEERLGVTVIGDVDQPNAENETNLSIYERALVEAALDDSVDGVLVALVPSLDLPAEDLQALLERVNRASDKPMVVTGLLDPSALSVPGIPIYTFPEPAAAVLGRASSYAQWRERTGDALIRPTPDEAAAVASLVEGFLGASPAEGGRYLRDEQTQALLAAIGVPHASWEMVSSADEAVVAAENLGYPVAVKAGRLKMRTAGEGGGVALDIRDGEQLNATIDRMSDSFGEQLWPLCVQRMAVTGLHLMVELHQDFERGASLTIGHGGSASIYGGQRQLRALPASREDLERLAEDSWFAPATTPQMRAAVVDLAAALAIAAAASPELAEIRLNPVLVSDAALVVTDASVLVRPWPRHILDGLRHMGG